jgi:Flp pilus assembly protein CpaB
MNATFRHLAPLLCSALVLLGCGSTQPQSDFLCSKRDLPAGTVLAAEHLTTKPLPLEAAPANVLRGSALRSVIGKALRVDVYAGDPLLQEALTDKPVGRIARYVRRRGRAYQVAVRSSRDVRRLDHVDILAEVTHEGKRGIVLVLQNVLVYRVRPPRSGKPESDARLLTLLLLPEEVELLAFGHRQGALFAALRGRGEIQVLEEQPLTTAAQLVDPKLHLRLTRSIAYPPNKQRATGERSAKPAGYAGQKRGHTVEHVQSRSLRLAETPRRPSRAVDRQRGIVASIEALRAYREALRAEQADCLPDTPEWRHERGTTAASARPNPPLQRHAHRAARHAR